MFILVGVRAPSVANVPIFMSGMSCAHLLRLSKVYLWTQTMMLIDLCMKRVEVIRTYLCSARCSKIKLFQ